MKRKYVTSSVILSIGYDPITKILEIEFTEPRKVYQYHDVPAIHYKNIMMASSQGKYFNQFIKDSYRATRVN